MMYETAEQERRRLALARWDAQYERRREVAQKRRERKTQQLAALIREAQSVGRTRVLSGGSALETPAMVEVLAGLLYSDLTE